MFDLLNIVIDNYINKWEPIWSKYLCSLDNVWYAPSTLRKYLNALERAWFVYQPYNSSGRIPTLNGLWVYLDSVIEFMDSQNEEYPRLDIDSARLDLQNIVQSIAKMSDGVAVWFLRNDEYYFIWINNILRDLTNSDTFDTTRCIVDFIENKQIIWFLSTKIIKKNQVYYTFVQESENTLSCVYAKVNINDYDGIISIVWPTRVNYKKNLSILKRLLELIW